MDKHQRKQMAQWEKTKAKTEHKFEERKKDNESRRGWDKVAIAIHSYTPSPVSALSKALELLKDPMIRSVQNDMHVRMNMVFHDAFDGPFYTLSGRRWIAPPPPDFEKEVRRGRERKDMRAAMNLMPTLNRHLDRIDTIREELLFKAQRNRVIQDCFAIKEELMMKAWHPDRVGRILETYGWEVLDNLLGVE